MVAFQRLFVNVRELLNKLTQMRTTAIGQHASLHLPAICEQPDPVSGIQSDLSQAERGIHGNIQLADRRAWLASTRNYARPSILTACRNARTHQASGINNQPDRLAALDLKKTCD